MFEIVKNHFSDLYASLNWFYLSTQFCTKMACMSVDNNNKIFSLSFYQTQQFYFVSKI